MWVMYTDVTVHKHLHECTRTACARGNVCVQELRSHS